MTTKPSFSPCQPTALGRRFRITVSALALSALIGLGAASQSLADTGSVYFDTNENVAAGDPNFLFNGTFTGFDNVGLGSQVMPNLTDGSDNSAIGEEALRSNTAGSRNVAIGAFTLDSNTTGSDNLATGNSGLIGNTTGNNNVAIGRDALSFNSTGNRNVAIGRDAGNNLTTGSDNVAIANRGKAGESGTIRIGTNGTQTAAWIAGIRGTGVGGTAQPVVINSNGKLGTAPAPSASTASLAATVEQLTDQLERQQGQIERLREQVKGG